MSVIEDILVSSVAAPKVGLRDYLAAREIVSIQDARFGGGPSKTAAQNLAAALAAQTYLSSTFGGGTVYWPEGTYALKGGTVAAPGVVVTTNIVHQGSLPTAAYDSVDKLGGTVINVTDGDYAFFLSGRHSGLRSVRLFGTGGTTAYGVVVNNICTRVEHVSVEAFEYGFAAAALNMNVWEDCSAHVCTKIGFVVLPQNASTRGDYAYPKLDALITTTGSTIFEISRCRFRSNLVGMAVLDGTGMTVNKCVIESNTRQGLILFKHAGGNCDGHTFNGCHFENDHVAVGVATDLSAVEALYTSAGVVMSGDVTGALADADMNHSILIAAGDQTFTNDGDFRFGPPHFVKFDRCEIITGKGAFRLRESYGLEIAESRVQSQAGSTLFSLTARAVRTHLSKLRTLGSAQYEEFKVTGGTYTYYTMPDTHVKGTHVAAASAAWKDICSVSLMTNNNKYAYSIYPTTAGSISQYMAQGYVAYDGATEFIVPHFTGSACALRISGGVFQYQQNSGSARDISYKVFPEGPCEWA